VTTAKVDRRQPDGGHAAACPSAGMLCGRFTRDAVRRPDSPDVHASTSHVGAQPLFQRDDRRRACIAPPGREKTAADGERANHARSEGVTGRSVHLRQRRIRS
jgi:hypothetical protein